MDMDYNIDQTNINQCFSTLLCVQIKTGHLVTKTPKSICIKWIFISAVHHCILIKSQSPVTAMKCHCLAPSSNQTHL